MKRVFILKGLDCPNCSAKIEKEVGALPGVESSVVNLMQQTLTVQSEKSADATLAEQVETIVHSHEPDVEVSEKTEPAVTKVYLLKGLDCPNCSAKIEKEVGELGGVASSTVNLMNQTLTVQAGTSVATSLLDTVTTIVHSHEPDVEVSEKTEPAVTKVYLLKGLDCPNCSAKIEKEVGELGGVASSTVNLMNQTLTVQAGTSVATSLLDTVTTIVHSHEPDVEVSEKTEPAVTKVYLLKGLDCPNCSAKIEKEVGELDGVTSSTVNLMNQTLTVQAGTSVAASLLDTVTTIVHSHEPDVEVSEKQLEATAPVKKDEKAAVYNDEDKKRTIRLAVGAVVYAIGMALTVFAKLPTLAELAFLIVAYVILGWDVVWQAVKNITRGQVFDEHFLMSVSTIGAFAIGEYPEAVAVMLFYQVGEFFQSLAVKRSRKSISDLMDICPDSATVKRNGVLQVVSPESVAVGEIIVVKPGEKIPLDGIVVDGESMLDTKALTGESVPRSIRKGDEALSGCINQSGLLTLKVTKSFGESTVSKITDLVENASARKAPTENFITTFARYYTPVVVGMAAVLAIIPPLVLGGGWSEWLRRGFVFLIVSCPCALVISIPLTFFGGIGAASKRGVLVKGSNYLEALNKVSVVVFDKTGTLTKGVFEVANIIPAAGYQKEQVLEYAAQAESYSNHPIAKSILATYGKPIDQKQFSGFEEISGHGISVMVQGKKVLAGNSKLMESEKIAYAACDAAGTKCYVAADGSYVGCILIADEVKPDSKCAIAELKKIGVEKTVMLTGDDERIGKSVADELGLDAYYAQLLPDQKVEKLEMLDKQKRQGSKLAFVGDGINDAPVLARADVGIAMGGLGSDAAIEAADVVLMTDEPSKLVEAIDVAKATKRIVMQNIVIALGIKSVFLVLGALGMAGMWEAVFGDVGVTIIAVLNAMRILKK
ncbi:heavy metal translocating P-type ATPase [Faecalibacterium langellae]|uniref:Cadmium-translocating P-type ATPase n=1 Tax=Faecalibacterium langellae TaxID=3435293 RepID=A0ACC9D3S1_9FIRM|nr:heavy metal translocating P-type ATPase [Faecalibacterium prausnitzii]PDX62439.1 cadmium-translocating P-type ATPase [Faecalibacterium prausnitzii]